MGLFVGHPADLRPKIPPSLIAEYRDVTCSRCGAELICHEPTRKRDHDGWEIVCEACASDLVAEHVAEDKREVMWAAPCMINSCRHACGCPRLIV